MQSTTARLNTTPWRLGLALAVAGLLQTASATQITGDKNCTTRMLQEKTVIIATSNATLTVTEPGEVEILLVGGGGGGGGRWAGHDSSMRGGAGGGGGVIHKTAFAVTAGSFAVTVGKGGAVNDWSGGTTGGGTTAAFGLSAYGGGCGAMANGRNGAGSGGSGGGGAAASGWDGTTTKAPGTAKYTAQGVLGHDGAPHTDSCYAPGGGGGGAGGEAHSATGGVGYVCAITGETAYYGGGGNANNDSSASTGGSNKSFGGGGDWSQTGGDGVAIVSFTRTAKDPGDDFALEGGDRRYFSETGTAHAFTQDGSLTVTGEGTVDILLVGGGGGGGQDVADASGNPCYGGGGGAGGVVWRKNIPVTAGTYAVTVGAGGLLNQSAQATARGGDTTVLGFTAHGGGYGAKGLGYTYPSRGASGGGGSTSWSGSNFRAGAEAAYCGAPDYNLGSAGANASANSPYKPGGGGGAGGAAVGTAGGIGFCCDITGEDLYYAGGGGSSAGGAGGGGSWNVAGLDGLGGGGGSNARGGSGVVIVRYAKRGFDEQFDDATGGRTSSFIRDGKRYRVHTFATNGTFALTRPGKVDLLIIGGGGAGGANCPTVEWCYGGGGGAGGVIHKTGFVLDAGDYLIVLGAGGTVGDAESVANGKATTAFGFTAWGGGRGAKGGGFTTAATGASGGGGSRRFSEAIMPGQKPNQTYLVSYGNLGHAGADAVSTYESGGGGGAGSDATKGNGGLGYACDITGVELCYAGGGNGNKGTTTAAQGSGNSVYGGGGRYGQSGGNGVVIVRHEVPRKKFMVIVR